MKVKPSRHVVWVFIALFAICPPTISQVPILPPRIEIIPPNACTWKAQSPGDLNLPIQHHQRHLDICRSEGNAAAVAGLLRTVGNLHQRAGKVDDAVKAWEEAIKVSESFNDIRAVILTLTSIGNAYRFPRTSPEKVSRYFQLALEKSESIADKNLIAQTLSMIASHEMIGGDRDRARTSATRSLTIREELGDPTGIAIASVLAGNVFRFTGEPEKAMEYFKRGLKVYESTGELDRLANTLSQIGSIYQNQGHIYYALEYFERSLEINERLGLKGQALIDLNLIGINYTHRREFSKALEVLHRKLRLHEEIETDRRSNSQSTIQIRDRVVPVYSQSPRMLVIEHARTFIAIAEVYSKLNSLPAAVEHYNRALELSQQVNDANMVIMTLWTLGDLHMAQGQYPVALSYFHRSLPLCEVGDARTRKMAIKPLARIAYINGLIQDHVSGREFAEKAKIVAESLKDGSTYNQFDGFWMLGAAYAALGDFENGKWALEKVFENAESNTSLIISEEQRSRFFQTLQHPYKLYIHCLMQLHKADQARGYAARALEVFESSRMRTLLESLNLNKETEAAQKADPALLAKMQTLQDRINQIAESQDRRADQSLRQKQKREIETLQTELRLTRDTVRRTHPVLAEWRPEKLTEAEIRRDLLDNDTVLLEYSVGFHATYLWVLTKDGLTSHQLPAGGELNQIARRVYELLRDPQRWAAEKGIDQEYLAAASKLSRIVFGPITDQIRGKRLVIVADEVLGYIPFSALPSPTETSKTDTLLEPMAVGHEIVSLPSASTLTVLRREAAQRGPTGEGIAIVADPVFSDTDERLVTKRTSPTKDAQRSAIERAFRAVQRTSSNDIPRLPFTRREADSIFSFSRRSKSVKSLDFEASRKKLLGLDLSQFGVIHFATHGLLNSEYPDLSGIILSLVDEKSDPVNGFLRLNEIYKLDLNAQLVVLSACQTALGRAIPGEGLIGLTRGFMHAGTPRVVASLWKVDDVATAELMKIFYQKMLKEKMRPAAALRAAKITMYKTKRWNAPYYWAAFELQGEWR